MSINAIFQFIIEKGIKMYFLCLRKRRKDVIAKKKTSKNRGSWAREEGYKGYKHALIFFY